MNWEILKTLIKTDFLVRYQNSFLGFIWVFLKPFLIFLVLLTIFSIFKQDIPHFSLYLLLGIILFQFFADGTTFGMNSLLHKSHIVLKVPFKKQIVVWSSAVSAFIHLIFALVLFFGFLFFEKIFPHFFSFLVFVFLVFCEFLWILGISFFSSLFVVRFRDLGEIWEVGLTALFYLVPIFYPLEIVPEKIRTILWWNPLTKIIVFSRDVLIFDKMPNSKELFLLFIFGVGLVLLGSYFFRKNIQYYCEKL